MADAPDAPSASHLETIEVPVLAMDCGGCMKNVRSAAALAPGTARVVGITLAAVGLLPPIFAAALQSTPDLGIMGNSARLLRDDLRPTPSAAPAAREERLLRHV